MIDSDPDFRDLVDQVLSDMGHEVIGFPKSDGAAAVVRESSPDVVILDILMDAQRKGFTTLTAVKNDPVTATIPVIASTPLDTKEIEMHRDELRPLLAGVLFKPFEIEVLERLVTDVLEPNGHVTSR